RISDLDDRSRVLDDPLDRSRALDDPLGRSPALDDPLGRSRALDDPLARSLDLEDPLARSNGVGDLLGRATDPDRSTTDLGTSFSASMTATDRLPRRRDRERLPWQASELDDWLTGRERPVSSPESGAAVPGASG